MLRLEGYQGFTYTNWSSILHRLGLWKRWFCPVGSHLWDECLSSTGHYMVCDACDIEIVIAEIRAYP